MTNAVPADPTASVHEDPTALIDMAKRLAPSQPVICDIGSRDALDGIHLAKNLDASELHIFEANPNATETCRANIAAYGAGRQIFFNPVAVSDAVGTVAFFPVNTAASQSKDIGYSSMFPVNPAYLARRQKIVQDRVSVAATTLDVYFAGRSKLPDILWIDVEGAELLVFKGAEATLRHVSLIHVEVSFRPMQVGKPLFWEIDAFLRGCGFEVLGFPPASRLKAFLVVHRLLPNLPWRWNAIYGRRK